MNFSVLIKKNISTLYTEDFFVFLFCYYFKKSTCNTEKKRYPGYGFSLAGREEQSILQKKFFFHKSFIILHPLCPVV